MCLSVAGRVVSIDGMKGIAALGGIKREAGMHLVPEVKIGDYVLLHAGFAIQIIDEKEAIETMKLLEEMFQSEEV
ncbi:MAG: HypC/HybG/HupF family hydrogenase formation chaperone [Spirochaetes bacterium]|nr:MAG: HypC/HybG/HupF family hydrogenase formation chaperone [Spirochaetota bacterium]